MIHTCQIPIPPSANDLWHIVRRRDGKGRPFLAKTKVYKDWLEEAALLLRGGLPPVAIYPASVEITIAAGSGFARSRDVDNVCKPCLDALRAAGVVRNDRVTEISDVWARFEDSENSGPAICTVLIAAPRFGEMGMGSVRVTKTKLPKLF